MGAGRGVARATRGLVVGELAVYTVERVDSVLLVEVLAGELRGG